MSIKPLALWTALLLSNLLLSSCFQPPFNNFQDDHRRLRQTSFGLLYGASVGGIMGAAAGGVTSGVAGAAIGATIGATLAYTKSSKPRLIKELALQDIQFTEYGSTVTLIVPTDKYFLFNSPRLHEACFPGLMNIVRLLKMYKCQCPIYIASFTDNVGSTYHKKMLTQARAEAFVAFLWAFNIPAQRLQPEGYEDKFAIGDNHLIHGSAYNRRIEIQWTLNCSNLPRTAPIYSMK